MQIFISKTQKQRGAATLFTSVMLLVAITLVAFLSGKTVLNETKTSANNYRSTQSVAAANYAMDLGVDYFDTGGFDRVNNTTGVVESDGVIDTLGDLDSDGAYDDAFTGLSLTSTDASQTTTGQLVFSNTGFGAPGGSDMKSGMITSTGFSDDGLATRTITQCVGPVNILRNDGPKQPLVAQGDVALTGNARIINRFTNTTIWSGGKVAIGSSSAMETYIKDPSVGVLDPNVAADKARLLSTNESSDTQLVSNRNLGNGLDIIDDDPSLDTLVGLEFFKNFFTVDSRAELKNLAGSQSYTNISSAITSPVKTGLIWVEGNQSMTGGTIGTIDDPAIIIINGNFTLGGNANIYGLLYVAGTYRISGTPTVVGANIVEGTNLATETPAAPPIADGVGTISLVYWQGFFSGSNNPTTGFTTVIAGSWRDW